MKYWLLFSVLPDDSAELNTVIEEPSSYRFFTLEPLKSYFKEKKSVHFSKFNEGTVLYDFIFNTDTFLIISERLKAILLKFVNTKEVEFLPVSVFDHKQQEHQEQYYILNPLVHQPIIDLEKSMFYRCPFDNNIEEFEKLVTQTDKLDFNIHLFRPTDANGFYVVSDVLKNAIEAEKIIGAKFVEANGWDGNDFFFDMVWDPSAK